jgi:NTE family protein
VGAVPSLSEAVFNTFQIMEKSIIRAKLRHARPDIYLNVDVTDVRVLEFHKAGEVLAQAARLKDDFKRQLELKLKRAEQCDT